jgi:hypothetical protein
MAGKMPDRIVTRKAETGLSPLIRLQPLVKKAGKEKSVEQRAISAAFPVKSVAPTPKNRPSSN